MTIEIAINEKTQKQQAKLDWYEKYYIENFFKYLKPKLDLTRYQSIEYLVLLFKVTPKTLISKYVTELESQNKI
jgi:translation initiation factor 2B subunit (eIF-2B alpha/beta/delta family)